jgi:hypothetical protein
MYINSNDPGHVSAPGLKQAVRGQPIYNCPVLGVLTALTEYRPGFMPLPSMLKCPNSLDTEVGVCCSLIKDRGECPVFRQACDDIVTMPKEDPYAQSSPRGQKIRLMPDGPGIGTSGSWVRNEGPGEHFESREPLDGSLGPLYLKKRPKV